MFYYKKQTPDYDYLAPDGSEIRLLPGVRKGSSAHCILPPGKITKPVKHKTVEEIWYVISGQGKMWQKSNETVNVVDLTEGVVITIPTGNHFQFANTGQEPLSLLIFTIPPWPGAHEAVDVEDLSQEKTDNSKLIFHHKVLPERYDELAPDTSEIRFLARTHRASCGHCVLPPGKTSNAVKHKTIEELWYVLSGEGEMWQRSDDMECLLKLKKDLALTIATGNHFQLRNTGSEPLCIVLLTMPPWQNEHEAVTVDQHWK